LVDKFGKDVAVASMEGEGVAERVVKKLKVETPKEELVEAYMTEIARFYGVPYGSAKSEDEDDDDEPSGGVAEKAEGELEDPIPTDADPSTSKKAEEREALAKASTPKKLGPQSPLRVVPPSPSTDNVAPRLKLPGSAAAKVAKSESSTKKPAKKEDGLGRIPDVDELAKRFAELKR
jgi:vacuolar protein sorting-associated protein IST1